jgi:hypothetical protein
MYVYPLMGFSTLQFDGEVDTPKNFEAIIISVSTPANGYVETLHGLQEIF